MPTPRGIFFSTALRHAMQASSANTTALIDWATSKHRILLDGYYGNRGLSWDGQDAMFDLFRTGQWIDLVRELRATARHDGRGIARTFYTEVVSRAMPHRLRRIVYRLKGRDPDSVDTLSARSIRRSIAEHDFAAKFRADDFDPWFSEGDRRRGAALRAHYMFDHNQYARDGTGLDSEALGIARRSPLGDRRLLEFMLTVPEPMFRRNGVAEELRSTRARRSAAARNHRRAPPRCRGTGLVSRP